VASRANEDGNGGVLPRNRPQIAIYPSARGFARLSSVRHRYPFESLHWLRQQRVDRQASVLCESAERAARALRQAEHAHSIRLSAEQKIAGLSAVEQARLDDGLVRACELQIVADWQKGAAQELAAKAAQERCAREAQAAEAAAEAAARRALGTASNEANMIDAHRDAFRSQRAVEQELSDEEAASEQWTASRFSSRRG
jgi:hypothetical protein